MTTKKTGLSGIAPPPRKSLGAIDPPPRKSSGNLSQSVESAQVQFNIRIRQDRVMYARILAAKSGRYLNDLIEEAIDLLEQKHGSV